MKQRREHFRVKYPLKYRPTLVLEGKEYKVIDISERGVRFGGVRARTFSGGQRLSFSIRFGDGDVLALSGRVVRVDGATVAVRLTEAIPLKKIRSEDLYLIKNFPLFRLGPGASS